MSTELPDKYDPGTLEPAVTKAWLDKKSFAAHPDARSQRYVVMMPLPNVTGALHMGHAMDNVMQDLLVRWHRMRGDNTLWQAGTDHAASSSPICGPRSASASSSTVPSIASWTITR